MKIILLLLFIYSSQLFACSSIREDFPELKMVVLFDNCSKAPLVLYIALDKEYSWDKLRAVIFDRLSSKKLKDKGFGPEILTLRSELMKTTNMDWFKQIGTHRSFCFDKKRESKFVCRHFLDLKYRKKKIKLIYNNYIDSSL